VLDFGLVKFFTDGVDGGQTHQGTFVGTPHYVSPEQARDEQPDPRSDVYSLGILLYLMLTGQVPFHASSAVEVLVKQLNDKPVPPRERRPDLNIDPDLEALVLRCLAKQRDQRVQSMDELLSSLTQVRAHIAGQSRGAARGPDPLTGVSPPGLLNPTPPVRSRPVTASGTPGGGVPLGSISSRVPNNTPRPISARIPHSIPPTPALVQTGPAVPKKRGPVIAIGAATGIAIAIVGTAWFVKSHRSAANVAQRSAAAAQAEPARMTMQIELDGHRPAEPKPDGAAATPAKEAAAPASAAAVPAPAQPPVVEPKAPAQKPARPAQKEQAKPAQASASRSTTARKPEPVRPAAKEPEKAAAKEPEKTVAKASATPPPAPAEAPAPKPVEPPPAPAVAASSIAGSTPPPTLPISTRPREVSSALLQTQKLNNPSPKIPEWFQRNFARQTMQAVYRICIGTDGRVSEIKILTALGGGVDDDLVKQIKETWTYRPQLIPLCADSKMIFRL
jgi:hypothetical protein